MDNIYRLKNVSVETTENGVLYYKVIYSNGIDEYDNSFELDLYNNQTINTTLKLR
jgi:hypothetical protein